MALLGGSISSSSSAARTQVCDCGRLVSQSRKRSDAYGVAGGAAVGDLVGFDLTSYQWADLSTGVSGSAPSARVNPSLAAHLTDLYVFGDCPAQV